MPRTVPTAEAGLVGLASRASHVRVWVSNEAQNLFPPNVADGTDSATSTALFTAVSGATLSSDNTQAWQDAYSLKAEAANTGEGVKTDAVAVDASTLYTASVYLRCDAGRETVDVYLRDEVNATAGTTRTVKLRSDRWERVAVQHTMGAGSPTASLYVLAGNGAVTFFADGFKLEARDRATRWTSPATTDTAIDLTNHAGRDWLTSTEWGDAGDQPHATAVIRLVRNFDEPWMSILPTRTGSVPNAILTLDVGQLLWIETQITTNDCAPSASGWTRVFEGRVDTIDTGTKDDPTITLNCRDRAGQELVDEGHIEQEFPEPASTLTSAVPASWYTGLSWPINVDTFMQSALDGVLGSRLWTLTTVGTPGWALNEPRATNPLVRKMPIFDLLRELAEQAGREVRFRWSDSASAFRLELFDPEAEHDAAASWTFDADAFDVTRMARTIADVRNEGEIVYEGTYQARTSLRRRSAPSQASYGRRFFQITEGSTSNIDSATEAGDLGDRAIAALAWPTWDVTADVPFNPYVTLLDTVELEADPVFFESTYTGIVTGVRHRVGDGEAKTELVLREQRAVLSSYPIAPVTRFVSRIAARGVAPAAATASLPQTVRAKMYRSTTQTVATGAGEIVVQINAAEFDRSGSFDDGSVSSPPIAYTFTVPYPGTYAVEGRVTWVSLGVDDDFTARIDITGETDFDPVTVTSTKAGDYVLDVPRIVVDLPAGAVITLRAEHSEAANRDIKAGADQTYLAVERVR